MTSLHVRLYFIHKLVDLCICVSVYLCCTKNEMNERCPKNVVLSSFNIIKFFQFLNFLSFMYLCTQELATQRFDSIKKFCTVNFGTK